MKNVQVIDGAINTEYAIFQLTDEEFAVIFPEPGQDIEFIEDVVARVGEMAAGDALGPAWKRQIDKPDAMGIHGTLFYELEYKKEVYPHKRDSDMEVTQYHNTRSASYDAELFAERDARNGRPERPDRGRQLTAAPPLTARLNQPAVAGVTRQEIDAIEDKRLTILWLIALLHCTTTIFHTYLVGLSHQG